MAERIRAEARAHPTPPNLRAAAAASLLAEPSLARAGLAISYLEEALVLAPGDALTLSDLSAAHLLRAGLANDAYELTMALSAASRALAADPALPEAHFNQALALESLFLREEARSAWDEYLHLDRDSPWASEAKAHIAALHPLAQVAAWEEERKVLDKAAADGRQQTIDEIVARFRQPAREYGELLLLGDWGDALLKGDDAGAARTLRVARAIGNGLHQAKGDFLLRDSVAAIDGAAANPRKLRSLAEGHSKFQQGFRHYKAIDTGRALEELSLAGNLLSAGGSPFTIRAAFYQACAQHNLQLYDDATASLNGVLGNLKDKPYPALRAHVIWMQALIRYVHGDPVGAIDLYRQALAGFEALQEEDNVSSVQSLLAESLGRLGRYREEWAYRFRALRKAVAIRDSSLIYIAYIVAAQSLLQQDHPEVALEFQDEGLKRLSPTENGVLLAGAYFWRGLMQHRGGLAGAALDSLRQAREALTSEKDLEIRRQMEADADMAEGILHLESDPGKAVGLLGSALAVYEEKGHHLLSLLVYQARARGWRLLGQMDRADADLRAGVEAYEKLGEKIASKEVELSFLQQSEDVFDEMIAFQALDKKDTAASFEFADRFHTRALAGMATGLTLGSEEKSRLLATEEAPLALSDIRQRLPQGTALVQYSVFNDRLLTWLILPGKPEKLIERRISRAELRKLVKAVRTFAPGGSEDPRWSAASAALYDLLVAPWHGDVGSSNRLVLVPDKELHSLPFSCLRDGKARRYLIEEHPLVIAPSATLFIDATEKARRSRPAAARTLVVGDPAFDAESFSLPRLPWAQTEAREIARLYPKSSKLLTGAEADKERFIDLAPSYERIHFAGHALVNGENPLLSLIVLAPPPGGGTGALYAREIYQLDLSRTRLVVLAGCGTASGTVPEGEGFTTLARAFLAAGAPSVVGALWDVHDEPASRVLIAFHQRVAAGSDPAEGLRAVQLELLRHPDDSLHNPSTWAAFEVFGAGIN
ncbi:MAG TPA: CHAT domain-containing protein [Thermoanaerobaculia bacterium]|nr:CHAT domain-containing protein [Thermoanaerobaculia bacterium]